MCTCLAESFKNTSNKSIGAIMNECEIKTLRVYSSRIRDSSIINIKDAENVSYLSIRIIQSLDADKCKALSAHKAKFATDAIKVQNKCFVSYAVINSKIKGRKSSEYFLCWYEKNLSKGATTILNQFESLGAAILK
jgi:hypothetical protein